MMNDLPCETMPSSSIRRRETTKNQCGKWHGLSNPAVHQNFSKH